MFPCASKDTVLRQSTYWMPIQQFFIFFIIFICRIKDQLVARVESFNGNSITMINDSVIFPEQL